MKQFIKALPARHPLAMEIRELYGAEGYGWLTILLDWAQDVGCFELTPQIVTRECGLNSQKVGRIFENLRRIFEESLKILKLFSGKFEKVERKSEKVATLPPQNPHGSTRDQEENRVEKSREEEKRKEETSSTPTPTDDPTPIRGGGLFFEMNLRGDSMREDEWVYRCLLEHRRSKGLKSDNAEDLASLVTLFPSHNNEWRRWATLPLSKRIAAFALTAVECKPDNHFRYALAVAEKGEGPQWQDYLSKAEEQVLQKDYFVEIL